jgi:small conductance mechanosensitive channel
MGDRGEARAETHFAVIILIAGALAAQWVARAVSAAMLETARIDETALPALASAVRYGVLIVTFLAALSQIGAVQRSMLDVVRRALEAADLPPTQLIRTVPAGADPLRLR